MNILANVSLLFAQQMRHGGAWGIGDIVIAIIICLAVIGVAVIACRVMGFAIPQWVWQIVAIVVVAVIAILAIRFLLTL